MLIIGNKRRGGATALPCADATVTVNTTPFDVVASGDSIDIPVLQDGLPVGSLVGGDWIVPPCPEEMPTMAYSLKLVNPDYKGPCLRVRRSSDNAEDDFGFEAGILDTASILTFVGAGDGRVVIMYDQMDYHDVSQTAMASQPYIVRSGVLETSGGLPALFSNGNLWLPQNPAASGGVWPERFATMTAVFQSTGGDVIVAQYVIGAPSAPAQLNIPNNNGGILSYGVIGVVDNVSAFYGQIFVGTTPKNLDRNSVISFQHTTAWNTSLASFVRNGVTQATNVNINNRVIYFNGLMSLYGSFPHQGWFQEALFYRNNKYADRVALAKSINDRWTVH
jgi:hypothetical protein